MIITDASYQGCGGLLLLRPKPTAPWQIHEAYEYELTVQDAAMLGVELSHRGGLAGSSNLAPAPQKDCGGLGHQDRL